MMKKTYKSSLLALSVLASFTSCSESESLQQANLSKDKITFHATLDNSWKPLSPASSSRAAIAAATEKGPIVVSTPFGKPLYLHPVVQDGIHIWSKEGKPITRSGAPLEDVEHERVVQTRGTMSTKTDLSDYQRFGVTAIYKEGENNVSLFQEENGDPKIAVATTSTTEANVWEIKDSRWPVGSEVSFHAFAPYSAGSTSPLSFKPDVDGEKTQIKYTALTGVDEIKAQPDLIFATAKGSQSDNALGLNFNHALTAVTFAIDKDLAEVLGAGKKLTSITLSGIPNEGTYDLAVMKGEGTAAPVWQFAQDGGSNKTGTYTFDLKDQDIVTGKDFALTSDNNTLMMIPQTLPESAKLNFQFELDGVLQSLIIDMKDQVWQPGKSVIYKLSASAIYTLSNPEVVYPTTWTAVGYPKQSFNANEAIGLYAVSKDGYVVIPNIKLVKQQDDQGNPIWKTENKQRFLFTTNYKYFAYYPYSKTETIINKEATTAAEFFKNMIDKWKPVSNQQDENTLVNQDLQVASGVVNSDASTLTFTMERQMGLAVLNLAEKTVPEKRTFFTDNYTYFYPELENRVTSKPKDSEFSDSPHTRTIGSSTKFDGNSPFAVTTVNNRYVQIVKPNVDVIFKAKDSSADKHDAWGFLEKKTLNVAKNNVVTQDITADAEFFFFARKYTPKKKYKDNKTETFTVPVDGDYKLQCWGAAGVSNKGLGGYVEGSKDYSKNFLLYICVGGYGNFWNNNPPVGVYNKSSSPAGGGCTSITTFLKNDGQLRKYANLKDKVVMVAGGGGSVDANDTAMPGSAGGLNGQASAKGAGGGTQTGGGKTAGGGYHIWHGDFGFGGAAAAYSNLNDYGAQGGGGWYGGGGYCIAGVSGGGSSYYSKDTNLLKDGKTIAGYDDGTTTELQPTPDGNGTQRGQKGHGVCIITQTSFR